MDPADFAEARVRQSWLRDKGRQIFPLFDPDNPLLSGDVFTHHPIGLEDLFGRSIPYDLGGISVRVASIPDLIYLKRLADRPRDRDDYREDRADSSTEER